MDQVLLLLLLVQDFVNAEEEPLFDQDVFVDSHIVFEKVTHDLNQALNDFQLDLT